MSREGGFSRPSPGGAGGVRSPRDQFKHGKVDFRALRHARILEQQRQRRRNLQNHARRLAAVGFQPGPAPPEAAISPPLQKISDDDASQEHQAEQKDPRTEETTGKPPGREWSESERQRSKREAYAEQLMYPSFLLSIPEDLTENVSPLLYCFVGFGARFLLSCHGMV